MDKKQKDKKKKGINNGQNIGYIFLAYYIYVYSG